MPERWKSRRVPEKGGIRASTGVGSGRVPGKGRIRVSTGKVEIGVSIGKVRSGRVPEKGPGEYLQRIESVRVPEK